MNPSKTPEELSQIADCAFDICASSDLQNINEAADTVLSFTDYLGGVGDGPTMGAMNRLPEAAREYLFAVLWGKPFDPVEELRKVNLSI